MDPLSDDEMAYHLRLVEQKNAADAAWTSWGAHLAAKYQLGDGDAITVQGQVMRAKADEPPPDPR